MIFPEADHLYYLEGEKEDVMTVVVQDRQDARTRIAEWRGKGLTSCLVPTMGGIHDGHLALMERARAVADRVVVSICGTRHNLPPMRILTAIRVARKQIWPPSDNGQTWSTCSRHLYHPSHATQVNPAGAALGLESEFQLHFFTGVATVVLKLLNQLPTDSAIFGQGDYQQLTVVRQLVRGS